MVSAAPLPLVEEDAAAADAEETTAEAEDICDEATEDTEEPREEATEETDEPRDEATEEAEESVAVERKLDPDALALLIWLWALAVSEETWLEAEDTTEETLAGTVRGRLLALTATAPRPATMMVEKRMLRSLLRLRFVCSESWLWLFWKVPNVSLCSLTEEIG